MSNKFNEVVIAAARTPIGIKGSLKDKADQLGQ